MGVRWCQCSHSFEKESCHVRNEQKDVIQDARLGLVGFSDHTLGYRRFVCRHPRTSQAKDARRQRTRTGAESSVQLLGSHSSG